MIKRWLYALLDSALHDSYLYRWVRDIERRLQSIEHEKAQKEAFQRQLAASSTTRRVGPFIVGAQSLQDVYYDGRKRDN